MPAAHDLGGQGMTSWPAGHFFLELRRALARLPGHAEPSMAWAACLAEPEMQLVTQMSCTHPACMQTKHNRPAKGQPPRAPEPLVNGHPGGWRGVRGRPGRRRAKQLVRT